MPTLPGSCSLRQSLRFRFRGLFLQAGCAGPEDLKGVARRAEPELFSNSPLDVFKFRHKKLDRVAARGANHVVVRSAVQAEFVTRHPIMKVDLVGEAALGKQFESAIDSCIANAGIALPYQPMQFLGAEMVARVNKHIENTIALGTPLEPLFAKMLGKDAGSLSGQIYAIRVHFIDALFRCGAQGFLLPRL